ncbi:CAP domain-containing protein [Streptomyces sp. SID13726]|uniref:CAP domain-containing protein n=1 Tax=Streptomyces sp. SID13726 TaxID=2706058 RepID=UPI0013B7DDF1|nr:CAP domain-containing protein [Streptomyces sp. SID13726]NEB03018.1 CAP domain-containing protein [Streptomyces sp. SID13726]
MGRHRRSAAGRAATGRATGVTETHSSHGGAFDPQDSYNFTSVGVATYRGQEEPDPYARSDAYLFASEEEYALYRGEGYTPADGPRRGGSHRRRKRNLVTPVKTGLLGVSAAVAIGTVAVATGVVPGLDNYKLGGGTSTGGDVQAAGSPTNSPAEQGGTSGSAENREDGSSTSRDAERASSPTPAPSTSTAAPTEKPTEKPAATPSEKPETTPSQKEKEPAQQETTAPVEVSTEAAAAAEVLQLVNVERAKVGCSPVAANSALADLAAAFSKAMADQGFFDHTDPSGATPWDRAALAGITSLGGENIARGQSDPAAVMEAWMNSPGHKANILNCDFKTLGVGVVFGAGGPWWTQDFGY